MKWITVSREYGAGGGEVAGRLARELGWNLFDRELLHRAAQLEHLPDAELEAVDEQAVSLTDRFRLHPPHERYIHGLAQAAREASRSAGGGRGCQRITLESSPRDYRRADLDPGARAGSR
jgi:Cytidylate kinase-like family